MSSPDENSDPLGDFLRGLGQGGQLPPGWQDLPGMPQDPAQVQAMLQQVQAMLAGAPDEALNWRMAHDIARQSAAADGDPSVGERDQRTVAEALRTADLWLDRVTDLRAASARTEAWSRSEWVERTLPTWRTVMGPVAESVSEALTTAFRKNLPFEAGQAASEAVPMLRRMAATFFGAQTGQALGGLAREVYGAGDTGLPLLDDGRTALLPAAVTRFAEGLDLPVDEVRLYLALREAAHARLFADVAWLRPHVLAAVGDFAREITIDLEGIESRIRDVDASDPQALQRALAQGLFEPDRTPGQEAALERLETALALVEGWIDEVVHTAAATTLPHAGALQETMRRRRAAGGPAERAMAQLVGLELRPRRLREAAAVWSALAAARGPAGRDQLWSHPDLLPTPEAFADPVAFARGGQGQVPDAMDAALAALLDGTLDGPDTPDGPDAPTP